MYYEEPIMEMIYFQGQDVVTSSQTGEDWDDEYNPWA